MFVILLMSCDVQFFVKNSQAETYQQLHVFSLGQVHPLEEVKFGAPKRGPWYWLHDWKFREIDKE